LFRLYDGTIASDYYQAMAQVEKQLDLQPGAEPPVTPGHLLAMVDALQAGTLNDSQRETVQALRDAILNMAEQKRDVKKDRNPPAGRRADKRVYHVARLSAASSVISYAIDQEHIGLALHRPNDYTFMN
jgi:uncharacterized membrane protein